MECKCGCREKPIKDSSIYCSGHNPTSANMKGKIIDLKSRQKTSETLKRKYKSGEIKVWNIGMKMSKEFVEKNRKGHLGQKAWNYIDGRSKFMAPARYGDDWDAIRLIIYKRDKFTCQDCGIKDIRLDVHHISPYLYSGDNSIENLIALCRSCHMKAEQKINKKIREKININGVELPWL